MAAPAWESKGADVSDTTGAPAFPIPVGVASGKIVVASMFINGGATTVDVIPSGFAAVPGSPVSASNHKLFKYWKRLSGADVGTYDFTLSASVFVEGAVELYNTCVASGSPFDTGEDSAVDEAFASVSPPVDVTTLGADRLILHSATCWSGGSWTPPAGYTKRVNPSVGLVTTSDKSQAVAGNTGSLTATTTTSDRRVAHAIALIGTSGGASMTSPDISIDDEARKNMLTELGLVEPQNLSNTDLMRMVMVDVGQTTVTVTSASAATHLERYLMQLRNA
jgi:hypothetical protein